MKLRLNITIKKFGFFTLSRQPFIVFDCSKSFSPGSAIQPIRMDIEYGAFRPAFAGAIRAARRVKTPIFY
ncbi:MAG: hypothetical protein WD824_06230 [Cyclobacteriaceae bacterium]